MFRASMKGGGMGDMLEFGLFVAILSAAGFAWRPDFTERMLGSEKRRHELPRAEP